MLLLASTVVLAKTLYFMLLKASMKSLNCLFKEGVLGTFVAGTLYVMLLKASMKRV